MSISPFLYLPFLDIFTVLSWFNIQHFHFLQAVGQLCQDPEPGGHQQASKPRHDTRGTHNKNTNTKNQEDISIHQNKTMKRSGGGAQWAIWSVYRKIHQKQHAGLSEQALVENNF